MAMPMGLPVLGRTAIFLACVAVALWQAASQARAAQEPPPTEPPSAVAQYVEALVTATAPSVPGTTEETLSGLSPASRRALKQASSSTAAALERVATSSTYGAPQGLGPQGGEVGVAPASDSVGSALRTTVGASTSDPRLLGLLLVVVATTAGTVALTLRRLRSAIPRSEETGRRK